MAKKRAPGDAPRKRKRRVHGTARNVAPLANAESVMDADAEDGFERLFVRLIWRLGLVSKKDVNGLSRRVGELERRVRLTRTSRLQVVRRKTAPSGGSSDNSAA